MPFVKVQYQLSKENSAVAKSITFLGMLIGSLFWGTALDLFGRRPVFIITLTISAIFDGAIGFSPNYIAYCVFFFLMGFGAGGNLPISGSFFLEFIPDDKRELLSVFLPIGGTIGAALSWILLPRYSCDPASSVQCVDEKNRGWRYVVYASCIFTFCMLLLQFFAVKLYESPRWYLSVGKREEAADVLNNIAQKNNKSEMRHIEEEDLSLIMNQERNDIDSYVEDENLNQVQKIFRKPKILFQPDLLM